ncbi:MAG: imidazoleglycerol-phosphate dehydratase HisB [Clostridiales bacterium]|jgi:imidazoleglycerol-phosphate dehydratase|nr:imidazoleglycerol-phosphate dehydratase HisB [Clostridiales bacterium]
MSREAHIERATSETSIILDLTLDGGGESTIITDIGFFEHMLTQIARHGFLSLNLRMAGDLHIDCHHTIEDTGIALGMAFASALGDKSRIRRYGHVILPMDETLVLCAIDFSGRPYLTFDVKFTCEKIGGMATEMVEEFFRAFCVHSRCALHFKLLAGQNNHHIAEGVFKAFGKVIDQAVTLDPRVNGVLSSKGHLD